jgi:hypothetical protein
MQQDCTCLIDLFKRDPRINNGHLKAHGWIMAEKKMSPPPLDEVWIDFVNSDFFRKELFPPLMSEYCPNCKNRLTCDIGSRYAPEAQIPGNWYG